jgi:tetratricopeptide (TPR) repeat protein
MLRLLILILVAVTPLVAQTTVQSTTPRSTETVEQARAREDSIMAAAHAIIARDSGAVDEYEKIAAIHKARKRFAMQLQIASAMAAHNPASATAHLVHGDALLDNDQPERAVSALTAALALQPNYVRARVMLAETFEILQQTDSALVHLDTALMHNPRHAQAHMQSARIKMRRGRTAEAAAHYRTACELLPDVPSSYGPWMKLAGALIATAAYDDALDALRYCLRLQPDASDPHLLIAEALEKSGRTIEAINAYNDFARRFPTDDRALDAERSALRLRFPPTHP